MVREERSKEAEYYEALLARDSSYLGTFVVGVKTTGIFCLPTCRARKPKRENSVFFTSAGDALRAGYRPCKICRPTEAAGTAPEPVRRAMEMLRGDSGRRVTDADLRAEGLSPETVRRWCKKQLGMTFHGYQRMLRINSAYRQLSGGAGVTDTAYGTGYESLSGFAYGFRKVMKRSPSEAGALMVVQVERFETPLGPMIAGATVDGLCLLEFTDRRMLERELGQISRRLGARIVAGANEHIETAKRELREYFDGERRSFTVPLVTPGSEFQRAVWRQLLTVPYGETRSYSQQAVEIGRPRAVRAVAAANGQNRVAIIIPCHRIIGADGSLTGYGGGVARKRWLLELEARNGAG
jgi:AraC family transcriptional regulator of adaptative response/methylated-DNA-[protein]-cysteine methyltransferase